MESKPLFKITILSWGGIGDTLRNLALVPHEALYNIFGIRCRVVYRHWKETGALLEAEPPEPEFFKTLIDRVPSLVWEGEYGEHKGYSRILNWVIRKLAKFTHGLKTPYFPFIIELTDEEKTVLPEWNPAAPLIGIQTHLSGMKTKRWAIENWQTVINGLLEEQPHLRIVLIDANPQVQELCIHPQISHTCGWNIAQSIALVSRLNYLISIDSWTKYVAAWSRVPQLIIVPDQRDDYPSLTAEKLVSCEFDGIINNENNTIIGLLKTHFGSELTLPSMEDLSPEYLLERTLDALERQKLISR